MADIIKGNRNEMQLLQDIEFQQIIRQIGGKENIYLVSDYCKTDEDNPGTLQEFVNDMFYIACPYSSTNKSYGLVDSSLKCPSEKANENNYSCKTVIDGKILPQGNEIPLSVRPQELGFIAKSVGEEENTSLQSNGDFRRTHTQFNSHNFKRTIDCPLVIFIFRQDFLKQKSNKMCLKEILKDVRARTKGSRPALLGLIRSGVDTENTETLECLELLARLIHSVFRKHHAQEICVGNYVPKSERQIFTVKRNVCKLLLASQTSDNTEDRGNPASWSFQCLPWPRRQRGQGNNALSNSERGNAECVEEGIPLKASALSAAHHSEIVTSKNSQHHDTHKS